MEMMIASMVYPVFIMLVFLFVLERVFYAFGIVLDFIWSAFNGR